MSKAILAGAALVEETAVFPMKYASPWYQNKMQWEPEIWCWTENFMLLK